MPTDEDLPEVFDLAITWEPIDSIKPHPENPRRGDVEAIRASIRVNGLYAPIYVRVANRKIIAHAHVWEACKAEGLTEVPVVMLDVDAAQARRIMLADNGTSDAATDDDEALLAALRKVSHTPQGLFGAGYTDDAMSVLVARVEGANVTPASTVAGDVPAAYVPDGERVMGHSVSLVFTPEQFALWTAYLEHIREVDGDPDDTPESVVLLALHAYGNRLGD